MLQAFKTLAANQFEAALCMLGLCVDRCPDSHWNALVAKYPFSQVAFHALFFTDFYLGENEGSFRLQAFHRENAQVFGDYEQLQDREPASRYDRLFLDRYLAHCRMRAAQTIAAETEESLTARAGFRRRACSRAELHVYNIRHLQHHAAQLSLRLRLDANVDVPWVGSGWRNA